MRLSCHPSRKGVKRKAQVRYILQAIVLENVHLDLIYHIKMYFSSAESWKSQNKETLQIVQLPEEKDEEMGGMFACAILFSFVLVSGGSVY